MVMKRPSDRDCPADLVLPDEAALSALMRMPGRLVTVTFRGTRVRVLAAHDRAAQQAREIAPRPVIDPLHLELLSGFDYEGGPWPTSTAASLAQNLARTWTAGRPISDGMDCGREESGMGASRPVAGAEQARVPRSSPHPRLLPRAG